MAYTRGSGFVGLTNYLGLNRQAGERMGEQLAQQVEGSTNAARGAVDAASSDFAQQVQAGTPTYQTGGNIYDVAGRAASTQYGGPTALSAQTVGGIEQKIADAQRMGQLAGTDSGRAALMGGTGSQGGRMLDAALAGRSARLDQAARGYQGLRGYLGLAQSNAAGQVASAQKATEDVRAKYAAELQQEPQWMKDARQPRPEAPASPAPAQDKPQGGQYIGGNWVPHGTPQAPKGPVMVGNVNANPGQPKKPKQGGQWVGGQWVPYG